MFRDLTQFHRSVFAVLFLIYPNPFLRMKCDIAKRKKSIISPKFEKKKKSLPNKGISQREENHDRDGIY